MKIEGKIKVNRYMTAADIQNGHVFIIENDDSTLYLACDEGYVDLNIGEFIYGDDYEFESKPVREVKCKLVIDEE